MNEEFPSLPSRPPAKKLPKRDSGSRTFSFRIASETADRLDEAALRAGVNTSDFIRAVLTDRLDGVEHLGEQMTLMSDQVSEQLSRLQESLAVSVEAILVGSTAGRVVTSEMARKWADRNLRENGEP